MRLGEAQREVARRLRREGLDTASLDARLIVMTSTGLTHERLIAEPDRPLSEEEARRVEELSSRRIGREPVSRLIGEREFHGRPFSIDASTLDPRPDTESLVALGLAFARRREGGRLRILDLGAGSGAILLSLLAELPDATGTATDLSVDALAVAERNARRLGLDRRAEFVRADWCAGLSGPYDLIVSNPPYIATHAIAELEPEVRLFDPLPALDGGPDGLDAYRAMAAGAGPLISDGGLCAVEIGLGQEERVDSIFRTAGWRPADGDISRMRDLTGRLRALGFARNPTFCRLARI